jgi:assimilatory nitrate reductase catalytic subunit
MIAALLFVGPAPVPLSRRHAVSQIGTEATALSVLSGRAGLSQPDPGAIVCACHDVGVNTLRDAIADGANTVPALGAKTRAGTNCGSCRSELAALIANTQVKVAAE